MNTSYSTLNRLPKADLIDQICAKIAGCIWTAYDICELEQFTDELQGLYKLPKKVLVVIAKELSLAEGPVRIAVYEDTEYPICLEEEGRTQAKWITIEGNYILK